MEQPKIIQGGRHTDSRGILSFVNDFRLDEIKRFYTIEHTDDSVVRAWQGHQKEKKWFYTLEGSFCIVLVQPDDWVNPSNTLPIQEFILNAQDSQILSIPSGYANGFKALQPHSKLLVFSNFTTEESADDNFRFDKDKWFNWAELETMS